MLAAIPTVDEIVSRASDELWRRKLLTNIHRAVVAEAIVSAALEPEWRWCAADYASCDFRSGGFRLEVKQSASLQSWNASTLKASQCSFDIAERSGEWDGDVWNAERRRYADIYVLCHHPLVSIDADHRDAGQWRFFVVPETTLPQQKTISIGAVERLASPVGWHELKQAVESVRAVNPASGRP